jgi:signal transduction histidine kinase
MNSSRSKGKKYIESICKDAPVGFMVIDREFNILYITPQAKTLLRLKKSYQTIASLPDYLDVIKSRILKTELYTDHRDLFIRMKNRLIYLEMYITPLAEVAEGEDKHYILTFVDKTNDLKKLDTIKAMQDELFQFKNLAAIGTMISGIAHELNNPISGISMSSQLAENTLKLLLDKVKENKSCFDEEFDELVENITYALSELELVKLNTVRSAKLIGSLLNYSKREKLELELINLKKLLDETIELTSSQPVFNKAEITIKCNKEIALTCDKIKIQQVLFNILKNAVEAIEKEGQIKINCKTEGTTVNISIADTGCGILATNLGQLFTPFFTTKAHIGGTGLGLSISHRIIERHGGKISVKSVPGKGSEFIIMLPDNIE